MLSPSRFLRPVRFAFLSSLVLGGIGCSSGRILDIDSKPPGASIFVNGEKKGTTRTTVELDFGGVSRVLVQLVKPRYKPLEQYFTLEEITEDRMTKHFVMEAE